MAAEDTVRQHARRQLRVLRQTINNLEQFTEPLAERGDELVGTGDEKV